MTTDYRATVFLPRTDFPMKAGLPKLEPRLLAEWEQLRLYERLRRQSRGREKFILHDGPPYANGHLHIGHALNKILKDAIVRCQQMLGKDSVYVPGWDCHGLPIEWKVEEQYRAAGKDKDEVPIVQFRQECREFAEHWIGVQREEFKRLGCIGDWENPYSTMSFTAEAQIAREVMKFAMNGLLYRGSKPVMWSVVEKTALAEAEIEYHDRASPAIWVRFPIVRSNAPLLDLGKGADFNPAILIWTTTPWTIPGNRAIAYSSDIAYVLVVVEDVAVDSLVRKRETFVVAEKLLSRLEQAGKFKGKIIQNYAGPDLAKTICHHPFHGKGYEFDVPLFSADFVTEEDGTGFVHVAPGHGQDDWELGVRHGLEVPETVGPDGVFYPHVPLFAGKRVLTEDGKDGDITGPVITALKDAGALLAKAGIKHSYPHSWRSKAPLIFRNTPQWFIAMDRAITDATGIAKPDDTLRARALAAIRATRWVPGQGQTRIASMIEGRPDWVISRQRAWGVPIPVFVRRSDDGAAEILKDECVNARILAAFEKEGADAWFAADPRRFLEPDYNPAYFEPVTDILDVWFESGATHSFVLETRPELKWPASLYLEGSDQHRGWFHSSLLESCGTRGRAPYEAVLTHGFVMAEDGQKMSKSLGNVVSPQDVIETQGADILRLWVVGSDYSEDLRIGPEILKQHTDIYRRLRNTLRYLLGNLEGFSEAERLPESQMPELERWVLHRLFELDRMLKQACHDFSFHPWFAELHGFCAVDLSAFYFDVRKDSLYCDRADAKRRRAARTVLDRLFDCLTAWLAPFVCFTAEEAWQARPKAGGGPGEGSVHERLFPEVPESWRDDRLAEKWRRVREARRVVTGALEIERARKTIGAGLEAAPVVFLDSRWDRRELEGVDFAEVCITSGVAFRDFKDQGPADGNPYSLPDVPGIVVGFHKAPGNKCARCWKVLEDVGAEPGHPDACRRCADAARRRGADASRPPAAGR